MTRVRVKEMRNGKVVSEHVTERNDDGELICGYCGCRISKDIIALPGQTVESYHTHQILEEWDVKDEEPDKPENEPCRIIFSSSQECEEAETALDLAGIDYDYDNGDRMIIAEDDLHILDANQIGYEIVA